MEEVNIYKCEICNKTFKYNSLFLKHKNKKKPCRNNNEAEQDMNDINRKYANITQLISDKNKKSVIDKCYFCDKNFSTKGNLIKHKNNACKNYKDLLLQQQNYRELINKLKNKDIEIANLKEENKKLQEENNKIIVADKNNTVDKNNINVQNSNINITNNKITNNKITNNKITNNNLHIHLNSFGKEDLSHITDDDYKRYIRTIYNGLISFIKHVHCSGDNPANCNIYLEDVNSKNIQIFENDTWLLKDSNEIISQLKDDKLDILDKKVEEFNDDQLKTKLDAYRTRLNYNKEANKILTNKIKDVLYNNNENNNKALE
jgi:hypothetical protein